eukprot:CAMPEP_0115710490 /NCGR_PEP_ID=MMETSP0272-20121206/73041_1 /TAXON_ID=71861 /ORGANISM="Scrippsiella trochoidea, Strain CCMP3099" /LENGTH=119 /DNA_ID=CAMNT_0003152187 /DNA_START=258 /DNA_END=616 /DNA_ORIENTATION=-
MMTILDWSLNWNVQPELKAKCSGHQRLILPVRWAREMSELCHHVAFPQSLSSHLLLHLDPAAKAEVLGTSRLGDALTASPSAEASAAAAVKAHELESATPVGDPSGSGSDTWNWAATGL